MPMVAWYVLSKVSYMKRVIRDVLPTVACAGQYLMYVCSGLIVMCRTALFAQEDEPVTSSAHALLATKSSISKAGCLLELLQRVGVSRLRHLVHVMLENKDTSVCCRRRL
jgi:hypothetical protein